MIKEIPKKSSKLKQCKSQPQFENISDLMHQMNDLKNQLRIIKQNKTKKSKVREQINSPKAKLMTEGPKDQSSSAIYKLYDSQVSHSRFNPNGNPLPEIIEIQYEDKDRTLKMALQMAKFKRYLKTKELGETISKLNQIIQLINRNTRDHETQLKLYREKTIYEFNSLNKIIDRLERERDHQKALTKQLQHQCHYLQQKLSENVDLKKLSLEAQLNNAQKLLHEQNVTMQELRHTGSHQQQKLRTLEQENTLLKEDINLLSIQSEKYKQQKITTQELFLDLQKQYYQYQNTTQQKIQSLQLQLSKWQNQCRNRRNQSSFLLQLQEQKSLLQQELTQSRRHLTLKNNELNEVKNKLYQKQKALIKLQSQVYTVKSERDEISRKLAYQMESIQRKNPYPQVQVLESDSVIRQRENKLKSLEQIHALIKQHRDKAYEEEY